MRTRAELESIGFDGFDSDNLLAMLNDPVFAEFERAAVAGDKASDALGEYFTDAPEADW